MYEVIKLIKKILNISIIIKYINSFNNYRINYQND